MVMGIGSRTTQEPELFTRARAVGVAARKEIQSSAPAGNGVTVTHFTLAHTRVDLTVESPSPVERATLQALALERFKRGAAESEGWFDHRIDSIKPMS